MGKKGDGEAKKEKGEKSEGTAAKTDGKAKDVPKGNDDFERSKERSRSKETGTASDTVSEASVFSSATSGAQKKKTAKRKNTGEKLSQPITDRHAQDSGFKGKPIAMTGRRYGVAITWDPVDYSKPVDLDLQAIIVDKRGYIVDAVYYNNLVALNGAVSHSGDEVTGQASDFDEMVWAVFAKLPDQVKMLLFVVAACGDSALRDAANATVHVVQEFHGHTVLRFPCEKSRADVDVIVMMEKDSKNKWWLYQVEEPAEHGEHFLDILEPTIGDIIRRRIDNAPKQQRVTFQMKKGAAVDLPKNALKRLNFSVMAVIKPKVRKEIDLDVSAVFADKEGRVLGAVYHDVLQKWGFQHSGDRDNDEDINVDLTQIPEQVHSAYIIVDLVAPNYKDVGFNDITYASCMANDQNCKTLASFTLESGKDQASHLPGLILCKLVRNSTKRWELEAVGRFCPGPSWKEAIPVLQEMNRELVQKTESMELDSASKNRHRRSRLEFRGSLPPETASGAAISPAVEPATDGDGKDEAEAAPVAGEIETSIMRTMSMPGADADPQNLTMTMSMEDGSQEARRAGRRRISALSPPRDEDVKDDQGRPLLTPSKGEVSKPAVSDSVPLETHEGDADASVGNCRSGACFLCPRQ